MSSILSCPATWRLAVAKAVTKPRIDIETGLVTLFLVSFPLFVVTLRSWASTMLLVGAVLCTLALVLRQQNTVWAEETVWLRRAVLLTLLAPAMATALGCLLRGQCTWTLFDTPFRFVLAAIVFWFAVDRKIDFLRVFQYVVVATLLGMALHQLFFPQPRLWGPHRMSTYFADPLAFGYLSLTLGLVSLASIDALGKDSPVVVGCKLLGAVVGGLLSVYSSSRTGWLAVPILVGLWWLGRSCVGDVRGQRIRIAVVGVAVVVVAGAWMSPMERRVESAIQEVQHYPWTGLAPETSVGIRISLLRIANDMFQAHPVAGVGDTRLMQAHLPAQVQEYATFQTQRIALKSGFHNEIVTNTIRHGLPGLVAYTMLFVVPWVVFRRQLRSPVRAQRANARVGIVCIVCISVSSLSTEVFDMKHMASFWALTLALLCASAMAADDPSTPSAETERMP